MSKRLFITGVGGFVGRYLCQELYQRGHEITGMLAPQEKASDAIKDCCHYLTTADLLDLESLHTALDERASETIIHLAAASAPGKSFSNPRFFYDVNVRGSQHLMEAIREHCPQTRLVIFSSSEVYGYVTPDELPLRESSPLRPANPYAVTKAACHMHARQYALNFGLDVLEARPFNMIGPHQALGFVLPDFASQVAAITHGDAAPKMRVGRLTDERDFLDIRDAARGIADVIEHGTSGQTYNICSGRSIPVSALLNELLAHAGTEINVEQDSALLRPSKMPVHYGSNDKLRALAGWQPSIPLSQTVAETLEFWQHQ